MEVEKNEGYDVPNKNIFELRCFGLFVAALVVCVAFFFLNKERVQGLPIAEGVAGAALVISSAAVTLRRSRGGRTSFYDGAQIWLTLTFVIATILLRIAIGHYI